MTVDPEPLGPGSKRQALQAEQRYLDRVYDRVEQLRRRAADRVAEAVGDRSGSTFQARFERDVTTHHHASRLSRFTFGDVESLAFGRLDLDDRSALHVGRLSVVDEQGEVVLVDWRAPAAASFYRATAARPEGVARRRTLVTRGRKVEDLDDELLDAEAADRLGLTAVTGQGALLAALSRERTGRMQDIVATIQADQDRIIRSAAVGTLVVSGGPGTGKTVVALHRVAYLLYQDRERFEGRGVLVVGPSQAFTEYTARVLPSLGEDRAVQRPLAALAPLGVDVQGWDEPEVAGVKGDLAMVELSRRLLAAVLPPIPPQTRVSFEGTVAVVGGEEVARIRRRLLEQVRGDRDGASYHERAGAADAALRAGLWRVWRAAHRRTGGRAPDEREGSGFDAVLDESPQVTMLHRCYWPTLRPGEVLEALATGRVDLASLADGLLDPGDVERLDAAWSAAEGWTIDDVAILDELAALLGPLPERGGRRADDRDDPGIRLTSDALDVHVPAPDVEASGYRDFAHVVVDEAQDLTPMQWRALARRGPYASWTVVGDLAQRSRLADPADWEAVAALIGRRQVTVEELTVNYRTPSEIVDVARDVLAAAGHHPSSTSRAVRSSGERPLHLVTADLDRSVHRRVDELLAARDGTIVVVAPEARLHRLRALLATDADDASALQGRVAVLDPRTVKGLEFDDVVVVAPDEVIGSSSVGAHQLYVAVTRATRSLTLVTRDGAEFPGAGSCERRRDET